MAALNVAWSLITGKPLFDYFKVLRQPKRVLYLCPEMGLRSFTDRVRKIGLLPYVGETLFCRTMSKGDTLQLPELQPEELEGAVVILDTAIRYLKGDENSSQDMRVFAESIFNLMPRDGKPGAMAVLLLHHSLKGTKDSGELTLENCMRGSGELGAFLTSGWGTRLQDPSDAYSPSYFKNIKPRDFDFKAFDVASQGPDGDCRLRIVADPLQLAEPVNAAAGSTRSSRPTSHCARSACHFRSNAERLAYSHVQAELPRPRFRR